MSNQPWEQGDADVALDARTQLKRPPLYKVFLHNDDFTSMEFVVFILKTIFNHSPERAYEIMMHVHTRGIGIAGLFPFETAEAKVEQTHDLAREHDFPLMCSIEPE